VKRIHEGEIGDPWPSRACTTSVPCGIATAAGLDRDGVPDAQLGTTSPGSPRPHREQHVHFLDFVAWVMHEQPPLHAWVTGAVLCASSRNTATFRSSLGVYEYPRGVRVYALTRQQPGCFDGVYQTVFGTKGRSVSARSEAGRNLLAPGRAGFFAARRRRRAGPRRSIASGRCSRAWRPASPINDTADFARSTCWRFSSHGHAQRATRHLGRSAASSQVLAPERYAWDAKPPCCRGRTANTARDSERRQCCDQRSNADGNTNHIEELR